MRRRNTTSIDEKKSNHDEDTRSHIVGGDRPMNDDTNQRPRSGNCLWRCFTAALALFSGWVVGYSQGYDVGLRDMHKKINELVDERDDIWRLHLKKRDDIHNKALERRINICKLHVEKMTALYDNGITKINKICELQIKEAREEACDTNCMPQ